MNKRKPLVRVMLKDSIVVDGVRRFFTNNDRGKQALLTERLIAAAARAKQMDRLRLEVRGGQ